MKFGLTKEQHSFIHEKVIFPLSSDACKVYCYGSRARGDFNKFSDLDLMLETNLDLSAKIALIKEELSKSNFPYKVDIVLLHEFAESYLDQYQDDKVIFK